MSTFLKGLRTLLLNGLVIALVAFLNYLTKLDWTQYVSPTGAVVILAGLNFVMRFLTDTPVGSAAVAAPTA